MWWNTSLTTCERKCVFAEISRALIPRAVTIALAFPIGYQLGAPNAITAAGVSLTGVLGANFAKVLPKAWLKVSKPGPSALQAWPWHCQATSPEPGAETKYSS